MTTCFYNDEHLVDPGDPNVFHRIVGWERKSQDPARRGGSDIQQREQIDGFACPKCVERLRLGLSVNQESLLDPYENDKEAA